MTDLQGKNYSYWDHLSARLIDAQASGLTFRVRQLGERVMKGAPHIQFTAHLQSSRYWWKRLFAKKHSRRTTDSSACGVD